MEFVTDITAATDDAYKKTIAVDFDGVLHKNTSDDYSISNTAIEGAKQAIDQLKDQYKIIIYSARVSLDFGIDKGMEDIKEFLNSQDIYYDEIAICKPVALYYIDDRAIHFTNWQDTLNQIQNNKQAAGPLTRRRRDQHDMTHTNHDPSIDEPTFDDSTVPEHGYDPQNIPESNPDLEGLWN